MRSGLIAVLVAAAVALAMAADDEAPGLRSYFGKTPLIDGLLSPGEWDDATTFTGARNWFAAFVPVTSDADLSLIGYVKHHEEWLYFAFDVTDDLLYGIDTERWLPPRNPKAHELTPEGYPWFGDEIEILMDAANRWRERQNYQVEGTPASWQMVCNLTKSRPGGLGVGGLLEGEPRSKPEAWQMYQKWILSGAQKAAVRVKDNHKGHVFEWAIRLDPCLEIAPGRFYSPDDGEREVGFKIALGDLDRPEAGRDNVYRFHHEQWFSGAKRGETSPRAWGPLRLMGRQRKPN